MTPKQKAELKIAEARKAALLASGNISIAAKQGTDSEKPRRPTHDKKKKPQKKEPEPETAKEPAVEPAEEAAKEAEVDKVQPESNDDDAVKDDWDAESDNVKDDWEEESEEEPEPSKEPANEPAEQPSKEPAKEPVGKAPTKTASEAHESSDSDEDGSDDDEDMSTAQRMALDRRHTAEQRRKERTEKALAERSADNLRSPCLLYTSDAADE